VGSKKRIIRLIILTIVIYFTSTFTFTEMIDFFLYIHLQHLGKYGKIRFNFMYFLRFNSISTDQKTIFNRIYSFRFRLLDCACKTGFSEHCQFEGVNYFQTFAFAWQTRRAFQYSHSQENVGLLFYTHIYIFFVRISIYFHLYKDKQDNIFKEYIT